MSNSKLSLSLIVFSLSLLLSSVVFLAGCGSCKPNLDSCGSNSDESTVVLQKPESIADARDKQMKTPTRGEDGKVPTEDRTGVEPSLSKYLESTDTENYPMKMKMEMDKQQAEAFIKNMRNFARDYYLDDRDRVGTVAFAGIAFPIISSRKLVEREDIGGRPVQAEHLRKIATKENNLRAYPFYVEPQFMLDEMKVSADLKAMKPDSQGDVVLTLHFTSWSKELESAVRGAEFFQDLTPDVLKKVRIEPVAIAGVQIAVPDPEIKVGKTVFPGNQRAFNTVIKGPKKKVQEAVENGCIYVDYWIPATTPTYNVTTGYLTRVLEIVQNVDSKQAAKNQIEKDVRAEFGSKAFHAETGIPFFAAGVVGGEGQERTSYKLKADTYILREDLASILTTYSASGAFYTALDGREKNIKPFEMDDLEKLLGDKLESRSVEIAINKETFKINIDDPKDKNFMPYIVNRINSDLKQKLTNDVQLKTDMANEGKGQYGAFQGSNKLDIKLDDNAKLNSENSYTIDDSGSLTIPKKWTFLKITETTFKESAKLSKVDATWENKIVPREMIQAIFYEKKQQLTNIDDKDPREISLANASITVYGPKTQADKKYQFKNTNGDECFGSSNIKIEIGGTILLAGNDKNDKDVVMKDIVVKIIEIGGDITTYEWRSEWVTEDEKQEIQKLFRRDLANVLKDQGKHGYREELRGIVGVDGKIEREIWFNVTTDCGKVNAKTYPEGIDMLKTNDKSQLEPFFKTMTIRCESHRDTNWGFARLWKNSGSKCLTPEYISMEMLPKIQLCVETRPATLMLRKDKYRYEVGLEE